jgi:CheY-like chemotaxis protein
MQENKPFQILVVDDEPPICELLERVASKLFPEASFINARSAQETIDHLDQQAGTPPQLILLDIDLGSPISGLDLIPELHARLKGRTPIIMLTSTNELPIVQQAYKKGAVAYTRKPDDLEGWRDYVARLRSYWHDTTLLPTIDRP